MITISPIHSGRNGLGHNGIAAGRFAELVDPKRAAVELRSPIPVGRRLDSVLGGDGSVDPFSARTLVATTRRLASPLGVETFPVMHAREVAEAQRRPFVPPGGAHPWPACDVCGNRRIDGQGLRLSPGPLAGGTMFATAWTPDIDGPVPTWLTRAALDCLSSAPAWAVSAPGDTISLSRLAVEIRGTVTGRVEHQILSRRTHVGPRNITTEPELVSPDGSSLAVATATWLEVGKSRSIAA